MGLGLSVINQSYQVIELGGLIGVLHYEGSVFGDFYEAIFPHLISLMTVSFG